MTKEELINFVETTFNFYGLKTVSSTDKNKGAYVPNMNQKHIFEIMNINPFERRQDIEIKELFTNKTLTISYYGSRREGSNRTPELRMGLHDLIDYFEIGDELLFATDMTNIFIYNLSKLDGENTQNDENEERLYAQIDIDTLKAKVQKMNTIATQTSRAVNVYVRNNALRTLVKRRSNYSCEMPSCDYMGFEQENGDKYIEVHHLIPLSQGGEDSLSNTVALCPICHRKLHYAHNKKKLQTILQEYIKSLN